MSLPVWRISHSPTDASTCFVGHDVLEHVLAEPARREHADRAVDPLADVAGVLERLPRALEEQAVLRIEHRGVAGPCRRTPRRTGRCRRGGRHALT